ncbi:MAG TPA: hypothetical protein DCG33_01775 [Prevotellaceae bacterium]|nr:hypothetical protein [Prevotellaceae bacterium]
MAEIQNIIELTFTEADGSAFAASALESANNAAESATNAFRYASAASDSAEESAESARLSNQFAVNASDRAGAAFRAKESAETAAQQAATSAANAATSETNASNSATSASESAATATTKANEASQSATAASNTLVSVINNKNQTQQYYIEAMSCADSAEGYANDASNSAFQADQSAQTASTKASEAAESVERAARSATTASNASETATTKASEASQSATNAATSAQTAQQVKDSIPADYTELSDSVEDLKNAISKFVFDMAPWSSSSGSVVKDITGPFASGTTIYARFVSVSGGTPGKGNIYGIADGVTTTLQYDCVIGEDYVITLPNAFEKIRLYLNVSNRPETLTGVSVFMDGSKLDIPAEMVRIRKIIDDHLTDYDALYDEVNHVPMNLYKGEYKANGYYDTDGTWVSNNNYKMLKLNNGTLHEGDVITFSHGFPFYQNQFRFDVLSAGGAYIKYIAGTYDGDKDGQITLTGVGADGFKLLMRVKTSQDASTFVAVTDGYLTEVSNFKVLSDEFSNQIAVLNPLKNKVINCLGDSFTASPSNTSWCGKLAERVGCVCNNYGVSSSRISVDSGDVLSFLNRYNTMDTSADITVIFGGINDANSIYFGDVSLGSMESALDNTTFYGALRLLIEDIKAYMPGKKIIGVIPPDFEPTVYYGALGDVQNACREVYEYYQIPYADLKKECQEMFEDSYNNVTYRQVNNNNNWHPSTRGHIAISEVIEGTLEMYIKA